MKIKNISTFILLFCLILGYSVAEGATKSVAITSPPSGTIYTTAQTVTITASPSAGGISKVEFYYDGGTAPVYTDTGSPYTCSWSITNANNGTHNWMAKAYYNNGTTAVSSLVNLTVNVSSATVPGAPTIGTATAGNAAATVNFTAPSSDGGSAITRYTVTSSPGGVTATGTASPITVSGLTNGTAYTFTVTATNAIGTGPASAQSNSVTPAACIDTAAPSVPTGLTAAAVSSSQINLSWSPSTDTGCSGLTGYKVFRASAQIATVASTSYSDSNLTTNVQYCYTVASYDGSGNVSAQSAQACATPQAVLPPALVGYVPGLGAAKDVVINPNTGLAYVASLQFGLSIVDVSVPTSPHAVGGANPPFYAENVAASGTLAVLTGNAVGSTVGLHIVDVSNPTAPKTLGTLTGTMKDVEMAGQYAYVLQIVAGNPSHTDLVVVNLSNPSSPAIVGRVTLPGGGAGLKVIGSLAYVSGTALQVVDVSNPSAPQIVGSSATLPGTAYGVAVSGGYAYVADNTSIQVLNVSTPSSPVIVGSLSTTNATAIAILGSRLYVNDYTSLKIIDVTNPAAPVLLSTSSNKNKSSIRLDVSASLVYEVGGEFDIVDASVPTAPVLLASLSDGCDNTGVGISGTLAVMAANASGLKIVDVSNPLAPKAVGSLAGTIKDAGIAGQYAYALQVVAGNPAHTDLIVVNLSVPSSPSIVGRVTLAGGLSLRIVGSTAYVAGGSVGLQMVNISNPAAPMIVGSIDTPGSAYAVAVSGGYAYVADYTSIQVINVSNPGSPVVVGSLATSQATAVAISGSRLYVIDYLSLKIIDVTNPATPLLLGTSSSYNAIGLDVSGPYVFLAGGGVNILDATNAAQPSLIKNIAVPGSTRSVTDLNGYVYAGDSAAIVDVIDLVP